MIWKIPLSMRLHRSLIHDVLFLCRRSLTFIWCHFDFLVVVRYARADGNSTWRRDPLHSPRRRLQRPLQCVWRESIRSLRIDGLESCLLWQRHLCRLEKKSDRCRENIPRSRFISSQTETTISSGVSVCRSILIANFSDISKTFLWEPPYRPPNDSSSESTSFSIYPLVSGCQKSFMFLNE